VEVVDLRKGEDGIQAVQKKGKIAQEIHVKNPTYPCFKGKRTPVGKLPGRYDERVERGSFEKKRAVNPRGDALANKVLQWRPKEDLNRLEETRSKKGGKEGVTLEQSLLGKDKNHSSSQEKNHLLQGGRWRGGEKEKL